MTGSVAPQASYPLSGPASLATMRRWLVGLRDRGVFDADDSHLEDIQLACTELAANAIEHAEPPCSVHVMRVTTDAVLIEVRDSSPSIEVAAREPSADATRGRGLHLIAGLARRWGVTCRDRDKVLWAWLTTR
ncbi:MAG TPA: ATP-binding protein [Pseudonocardiaceae bacterium]|nr:ATP-binding protein [Pseudonocardiaceae bacterium]